MRDIIKKILKEESEVKEMGLNLNKVRYSQPSNYLIKSLIKKEKGDELKNELKKMTQKCNDLYSKINTDLKNIKWEDIEFSEKGKFLYVMLPKRITNKMKDLTELYEELNDNYYTVGLNPINKISQMAADYKEFIVTIWIYMYTDQPRNRTHFPKGLPKSLLGYNIGVKIYRSLLNKLGFIQSEKDATSDVQEVYRKLLQMPDVNAVIYNDSVLLIEDGLPKEKVIDIVTDSIYERYLTGSNKRKLVLNRNIIVNTKLLRIIGETKLLNLMYELFYTAKKEYREPFETIGYRSK
jgi:hypothetical protein